MSTFPSPQKATKTTSIQQCESPYHESIDPVQIHCRYFPHEGCTKDFGRHEYPDARQRHLNRTIAAEQIITSCGAAAALKNLMFDMEIDSIISRNQHIQVEMEEKCTWGGEAGMERVFGIMEEARNRFLNRDPDDKRGGKLITVHEKETRSWWEDVEVEEEFVSGWDEDERRKAVEEWEAAL